MDERDDLGEVWGREEQQAYERAQAFNVDAIASFVQPGARNQRGQPRVEAPPAPVAPYVPLYKWHRQCYGDYLEERLHDYETDESSAVINRGDEPSSSGGESEVLRGVAHRDRVREYHSQESSSNEPPTDHMMSSSSSSQHDDSQQPPPPPHNKRRQRHQAHSQRQPKRARYHESMEEEGEQEQVRRQIQPGECFLCGFGDEFHDGIEAPHANYMQEMIRRRYAVKSSNLDLAISLHLYFKENVYDPQRMCMLTVAMAQEHLEGLHTLNANIWLGETLHDMKRIAFLLKNMIFRSDGTYNEKALADYQRTIFNTRQVYNMRLASMNFNQDCTKEDQRPQASYFTLMPPQSNRREQRQRHERVEKTRDLPTFRLT